jgi:hypothetical protein
MSLALFPRRKRTRRARVGVYEPPEPRALPSIDALVEEGLLIIESGVRLSVKNQAILWALRDGVPFDHLQYLRAVREQLLATAAESAEDAERIAAQLAHPVRGPGRWNADDEAAEPGRLERRLAVLRGLSTRLHALTDDESYLARLALSARDAAWEEIGTTVKATAMLAGRTDPHTTWDERDAALARVRFDLEELEARRERDR